MSYANIFANTYANLFIIQSSNEGLQSLTNPGLWLGELVSFSELSQALLLGRRFLASIFFQAGESEMQHGWLMPQIHPAQQVGLAVVLDWAEW